MDARPNAIARKQPTGERLAGTSAPTGEYHQHFAARDKLSMSMYFT
jgi:hypothetical protein